MNSRLDVHSRWSVLAAVFAAAFAVCLQPAADGDRATANEVPDLSSEQSDADDGDVSEDNPTESCDDGDLVEATTSLWQALPEEDGARSRLRNRCGSGDSIDFEACSCESLREYLTTAAEIEQWRGECCAQSETCAEYGRCTADEVDDDRLVDELKRGAEVAVGMMRTELPCPDVGCAATEQSCLRSAACTEEGRCGVENGRCVPTEEAHCLESQICEKDARCSMSEPGGECVLESDDDCARSEACRERGWCSHTEVRDRRDRCEPGSDEDCRQSKICENAGKCYRREGDDPQSPRARCYSPVTEAVDAARDETFQAHTTANAVPFRAALAGDDVEYSASREREFETRYRQNVLDSRMETSIRFPDPSRDEIELAVDCLEYHRVIHDHEPPEVFRQGQRRVYFDSMRIRSDDHVLYDEVDTFCDSSASKNIELVGWVGPVWTVHYSLTTHSAMGGSYQSNNWRSHNLDNGETAALDLLVESDSLIAAIREDAWVADHLESVREIADDTDEIDAEDRRAADEALENFEEADTLDELETALAAVLRESNLDGTGRSRSWNYDELFGGYAFGEYDPDDDRVAMRLEVSDREQRPPMTVVTLGLWVEPREAYREDFRRAAREGWLKSEAEQRDVSMSVP